MQLKTDYSIGEIPHSEHPEPQRKRDSWLNLNGTWEFAKVNIDQTASDFIKIIVPFSPESMNSGICGDFVLKSQEKLVYRKFFNIDESLIKGTMLIHFGAVDSKAEVYINDKYIGCHECGYTPFTFDITDYIIKGENKILVEVTDNFEHGAKGKQNVKRGGIWYTPQSGIWQTVWIESMPKNHIKNLRFNVDAFNKTVKISAFSNGINQTVSVFDDGTLIIKKDFTESVTIQHDFKLWSPETPKLYDVLITNDDGDKVKSYFGVRSFGIEKDKNGKKRLFLNGEPYFMSGVLDQGYWSDGLLTHPNDQALIDELMMLKNMGFNTVRKHIKIEPMRWYYHCDRLGLIVWQDFVNGGNEYKFNHIATFPFLGFKHRDNDYKYFARENEQGRKEFLQMIDETLDSLYNCVSIGVWVIFNEGWGQFDSAKITQIVKEKDSSRIIDSVSGWHDQGVDKTTLLSLHTYYTPLKVPKDTRAVVLSEFGGYSMKIDGHVYDEEKEFGYKKFKSKQALESALEKLYLKKVCPLIKKGLSACIYTQVSDVEEEINGLVTYDRKIVKVSLDAMNKLNSALYEENQKIK